ncbi:MAG: gluconokinase [Paracoccaceae bacterium]
MRGKVVFIIGVAGSGKSTVAQALADKVGGVFLEGDEFHSPENVATMAAGQALTDEMRWGWLKDLAAAADKAALLGRDVLVSCSGLKRAYRDVLREGAAPCQMVFLDGDKETILARMALREGHYMPVSLLDSQFDALEVPDRGEDNVVKIDVSAASDVVAATVARAVFKGE